MMGGWIRRAKSGDVQAARKILEDFIEAVRNNTDSKGNPHKKPSGIGTEIDERVIRYLAECFGQVLDGVSAGKALGIKPGEGGRPKDSGMHARNLQIGYEVANLKLSGVKVTKACEAVAKKRNLEVSGVKKIYYAHKVTATKAAQFVKGLGK